MYCNELDRLLETHSELTLEFFRQDGRTQEFYASEEQWVAEYERLAVLGERLQQLAADVVDHRRLHHCGSRPKTDA